MKQNKESEYGQTGEENRAIYWILGVFWSVRRKCISKLLKKEKVIHIDIQDEIKYNEYVEYNCKNKN